MRSEELRGPYRRLMEHYDTWPIFEVSGDLRYTRSEAIHQLKCANWVAFKKLEKLMKRAKIRTARQLFNTDPKKLIDHAGIGHVTLYVAMCILDHEGYTVPEWWGWQERERARAKKSGEEIRAEASAATA